MKTSSYSLHYENLRAWMKEKREEQGLSQRAVAELLGRHHSVVGKMEQNRRKIDLLEFIYYCEAIGAEPREGLEIMIDSIETNPDA